MSHSIWTVVVTFAGLLLNRSHKRTQVSKVRREDMSSIACNLNELLHTDSSSDAQREHLHSHVTQHRGWSCNSVIRLAVCHQNQDLTEVASCKQVPPGVREGLAGLSTSTRVLDSVNGPEDAVQTLVLAKGEYWDDTVRVDKDSYSGVSRRYDKGTD